MIAGIFLQRKNTVQTKDAADREKALFYVIHPVGLVGYRHE